MPSARKVLIVEDESLILGLLAEYVESIGYFVYRAQNAAEARTGLDAHTFDAAIIDIQLGQGPSGFDFATVARKLQPAIGLVFLTNLPNPKLLGAEIKTNFKNATYLLKSKVDDLAVLKEHLVKVTGQAETKPPKIELGPAATTIEELSNSQIAVLKLVAEGKSNREIAAIRGTSIRAVETLLHRALQALGIGENKDTNLRVVALREYLRATGQLRDGSETSR